MKVLLKLTSCTANIDLHYVFCLTSIKNYFSEVSVVEQVSLFNKDKD